MGRVLTAVAMLACAASTLSANPYRAPRGVRAEVTPEAAKKAGGGGGCGARVASKVYRCDVTSESGAKFTDCFRFASPGEVSDKFDLTSDQLGATLGCTCKATGSRRRPKFNGAPAFVCSGGDGDTFEGSVSRNGKSISAGFAGNAGGGSFVFGCRIDPACTAQ